MKKYTAVLLALAALACIAEARDWKVAVVIGISESNVSGPLIRETHTMHYTVETEEMVLMLEYSFHPSNKNSAPGVGVNARTKISIGGRHAYILDNNGKEVKMRIVKKIMK
jgi:hypothetical protein